MERRVNEGGGGDGAPPLITCCFPCLLAHLVKQSDLLPKQYMLTNRPPSTWNAGGAAPPHTAQHNNVSGMWLTETAEEADLHSSTNKPPSLICYYWRDLRSFSPFLKYEGWVCEAAAVPPPSPLPSSPPLAVLTCTPVSTTPGRAETDAAALSTDSGKVCLQAKISRASVDSLCFLRTADVSTVNFLNAFGKLLGKKTQGNPMFSVFYRVYFHLSFVYQILFDFGFDRGALCELRLWKELFH